MPSVSAPENRSDIPYIAGLTADCTTGFRTPRPSPNGSKVSDLDQLLNVRERRVEESRHSGIAEAVRLGVLRRFLSRETGPSQNGFNHACSV